MARRNQLTDVAAALLGSFASRNNDVGGYWGLGLLRALADSVGVRVLRLDLKTGGAEPVSSITETIARAYASKLERQLAVRSVAPEVVAKAEVVVEFFGIEEPRFPSFTYGPPVHCRVVLVDRQDRTYRRSLWTHCAPHDPRRESRSGRADE